MPTIKLLTEINSTIEVCFDLSTSIDLHKISTSKTKEQAIAGKTSGLIKLDEFVTWQATHFGFKQKLTSKITAFKRPYYFVDEQLKGPFKSIRHEHIFAQIGDKVIMTDVFEFHSPLGMFGRLFNKLIFTSYMRRFLMERNNVIKEFAENGKWKLLLGGE